MVSRPPLVSFAGAVLVLAVALSFATSVTMQATWLPLCAFGALMVYVARGLATAYPHEELGLCNVVTLIRATLVAFLSGVVIDPGVSSWLILGVASLAFALDGVDGWLARRSGLSSVFGARLDMETDAALAAVLALWLLVSGATGLEILILGFTRYTFVLAAQVWPELKGDLPASFRRKAICVLQIGALIVLICPLSPDAVIVPVSYVSAALVAWSFAIDVLWLLRQPDCRSVRPHPPTTSLGLFLKRPGLRQAVRLLLAAGVFYLLLILPNNPSGLNWTVFTRFPLELPIVMLVLLTVGRSRWSQWARVAIVAVLLVLVVLKIADLAMESALSRSFNPVADLALIDAGMRLLTGALGPLPALLAVLASLLAVAAVAVALWWATGVWAEAAPKRATLRGALVGATALAAALAIVKIGEAMQLWEMPIELPGSALTARVGVQKARMAQLTLADLRVFEAAAASDRFAGSQVLLDRIDRDVIVVFVESYGRASLDTALYADLHRATLEAGQAELTAFGLSTASGFLASPSQGGQSWLAHATFANGLWIDQQTRYSAALASDRQTLFHLAARAAFHTAAVMPQITLDWPESSKMGFETVLAAKDLGYQGLSFNWVTMPDQFTFTALDRLLRDGEKDRPYFIQVASGSSHAPWVPVPELVPWDQVGDGRIFSHMATAGDPSKVVWRDRDRVRAQYRLAVDYALQTVLSYAAQHADDPPLMIVMGDHQAASFVSLDERPDVPIHVIGPAHLVRWAASWGLASGLIPPPETQVLPMDHMRDLFLRAFSSILPEAIAQE